MNSPIKGKSKTPLQFRVFHTLLGLTVFFSLITVPAESQVLDILGMPIASELLWWPLVFFSFQLIYSVYGFIYLRHAVYLVILFHAIYILFLKFAIWLPSSSFWTMQETYTNVLGRDFIYLLKSYFFLWGCALLPIKVVGISDGKKSRYLFLVALMIFSLLDMYLLNPNNNTSGLQLIPLLLIYGFINIFSDTLTALISRIEHITPHNNHDGGLFGFQLPNTSQAQSQTFRYHHILFCSSIVFFIASKTMASKFISIGFL